MLDVERAVQNSSVLLVDDDPILLRSLEPVLRRAGYQVSTATTSEEAMSSLGAARFDVMVSDVNLPGTDGLSLLRDARAVDEAMPVVLLTGEPSLQTAIRALELGAFRYLVKPSPVDDLKSVLKSAVQVRRLAELKSEALALFRQEALGARLKDALAASFERALATLTLVFQPIVDSERRVAVGYEALMRSAEPSLPHPGAILEAAELVGRSLELGRAIRALAAVALEGTPELTLFVNLNAADLEDPELIAGRSPLTKYAARVVLEITERESLARIGDIPGKMRALREQGFRIAVDDLGAGYSGLTSVTLLEPELVKLDMTLVRGIQTHGAKQRLVRSLIQLCNEMGIAIVAEGVEVAEERATLESLGCKLLQGYLFARPGPPFPSIAW